MPPPPLWGRVPARASPRGAFFISFFWHLLLHCSWPLRGYVGGWAVPPTTILRVFMLVPGHHGGEGSEGGGGGAPPMVVNHSNTSLAP